jgi:hypothetical protein
MSVSVDQTTFCDSSQPSVEVLRTKPARALEQLKQGFLHGLLCRLARNGTPPRNPANRGRDPHREQSRITVELAHTKRTFRTRSGSSTKPPIDHPIQSRYHLISWSEDIARNHRSEAMADWQGGLLVAGEAQDAGFRSLALGETRYVRSGAQCENSARDRMGNLNLERVACLLTS